MNIGVILASGNGTRVSSKIPKQFIEIMGKPILAYTLEIFQNNENIDALEIVCQKDWIKTVEQICDKYNITKKTLVMHWGIILSRIYNEWHFSSKKQNF